MVEVISLSARLSSHTTAAALKVRALTLSGTHPTIYDKPNVFTDLSLLCWTFRRLRLVMLLFMSHSIKMVSCAGVYRIWFDLFICVDEHRRGSERVVRKCKPPVFRREKVGDTCISGSFTLVANIGLAQHKSCIYLLELK